MSDDFGLGCSSAVVNLCGLLLEGLCVRKFVLCPLEIFCLSFFEFFWVVSLELNSVQLRVKWRIKALYMQEEWTKHYDMVKWQKGMVSLTKNACSGF
jgi:hypothetical protein